MKVCIAIEKFDPSVGGAERYCWDLAHYLADKGHGVAVICMQARDVRNPSITVRRIRALRFPQGLRHLSFALMHRQAARALPDYIHFGVGNTFFMDVYQPHGGVHKAWFVRDSLRTNPSLRPYLRLIKRLSLKDVVQRSLEWWTFKVTRPWVIAISEMVAHDIRNMFDYPSERIHLIPNGIDQIKFTPDNRGKRREVRSRFGLHDGEFVFVFVANNLALKGYGVLLEACRRIGTRNFKVLVIGPASAKDQARAKPLNGTFVFGGKAADLEYIYPACDCLVHPSYYDACSLVVLEALSSGIPVITTTANGASMFVGANGSVIPPADPGALAQAMQAVCAGKVVFNQAPVFKDQNAVFAALEAFMLPGAKP